MEKVFLLKDLFRKGFFFQNIFLEKVFKNLLKVAELEREFTDCNYLTRLRFAFIDAFCHFYCNSHLDCRQGQTYQNNNHWHEQNHKYHPDQEIWDCSCFRSDGETGSTFVWKLFYFHSLLFTELQFQTGCALFIDPQIYGW